MSSSKKEGNEHPEINEDLEIDPKTPNSLKELLDIKNNFLKDNPFNNYKFKKTKINKIKSKNKVDIKNLEISSMEEFGKMLDEIDNNDPSFKVFAILVFISNFGSNPIIDQGVILSLLDKIENFLGNNLDNFESKLIELESDSNLISQDEIISLKINLKMVESNYKNVKKAYRLIKDLRIID